MSKPEHVGIGIVLIADVDTRQDCEAAVRKHYAKHISEPGMHWNVFRFGPACDPIDFRLEVCGWLESLGIPPDEVGGGVEIAKTLLQQKMRALFDGKLEVINDNDDVLYKPEGK